MVKPLFLKNHLLKVAASLITADDGHFHRKINPRASFLEET